MKQIYWFIAKLIIFSMICVVLLSLGYPFFRPKSSGSENTYSRITTFYKQPKNSLDVLFIGSSSFLDGISPLILWEEEGIASYNRATSVQAPAVSYYYLIESLKYQQPRLVVVDGVSLFRNYDVDKNEGFLRNSIDPMRLSIEKIRLILDIVAKSETQTIDSYLFPFIRYHSRWNDLRKIDFEFYKLDINDRNKGMKFERRGTPREMPENYMIAEGKAATIDENALYYFERIIQVCKEKNIQVLFLTLPRLQWNYSRHLAVQQLAEKHGLYYIDYSSSEHFSKITLDLSKDFYDDNHLNVYGAQKATKYLSAFLAETYDLPDRRNDASYSQWNMDLAYFKDQLALAEAQAAESTIVE